MNSPDARLMLVADLIEYERWAMARALGSLRTIPRAPASAHPAADDPHAARARGILGHNCQARHLWLSRLGGVVQRPFDMFPAWSAGQIAQDAAGLDDAYLAWLERSAQESPNCLDRIVAYKSLDGLAFESSAEEITAHVHNHGAYHRGQVARLVKLAGGSPARTDFIADREVDPAATLPAWRSSVMDRSRGEAPRDLALVFERAQLAEAWATNIAIDSMRSVPANNDSSAELSRARSVLAHTQETRHWWLSALGAIDAPPAQQGFAEQPIADSAARAAELDAHWTAYLARVTDADLARVCELTSNNRPYRRLARDICMHVLLHGSYHRGQIAMLVTQAGGQRKSTDLIGFTRRSTPGATEPV
jgi:uncharacterized damage-inducible protein DinB